MKTTSFINLALIKDEMSWRRTVQESVDDIIGLKEKISYKKMFNGMPNLESNLILLEGRPGSGKTTLMNEISKDWANRKLLTSKLIIFIPLRRLNAESDRSLATVIRIACPSLPLGDVSRLEHLIGQRQGKGVAFALDGLDEYVPLSKQSDEILELLHRRSLIEALVIVTSRPAACTYFRDYAGKQIEVLGFQKPQIIEYIHHYFGNDTNKIEELTIHLQEHPNLINMCYLPLHCAMLAFLYKEDTILPETETKFYEHFTLSTLLRSVRKRYGKLCHLSSFDQLSHEDKVVFYNVCRLAFDATVNVKQVFTSSDIEEATDSGGESVVNNQGLVVIDQYFVRYGVDRTYTFLHLTFQEYLAAVHIARLNESKKMDVIRTHCHRPHLSLMWRFLCGMMNFSHTNAMDIFKILTETIDDQLFRIQCGYESQHSLPCTHVVSSLNYCLKFREKNLTPTNCVAIGYVINRDKHHTKVDLTFDFCSISTEGATGFLKQVNDHPFSLKVQ